MHGAPRRRAPARNSGGACGARRGASSEPSSTTKAASAMGRRSGSTSFARCSRSSTRDRAASPERTADANNTRGAAARRGGRANSGAADGRAGPRARAARPRHRCSGADVPPPLRRCEDRQVAAVLQRGRDARRAHTLGVARGGGARRPHHHRLVRQTVKLWRDGACERTIQAHANLLNGRWQVLPGGARFVSGSNDCTAKLWTLDGASLERTEVHNAGVAAALPDGVHFMVGTADDGEDVARSSCTTSTGRSSTPSRGTSMGSRWRVTPDGQHIISGSATSSSRWSVATKSRSHLRRAHRSTSTRWRRCPTASASSAAATTIPSACGSSTAPTRTPSGEHAGGAPVWGARGAACDNQHALSGAADKTVKLFNVNDGAVLRTFKHHTSVPRVNSPGAAARRPPRFVSGSATTTPRARPRARAARRSASASVRALTAPSS